MAKVKTIIEEIEEIQEPAPVVEEIEVPKEPAPVIKEIEEIQEPAPVVEQSEHIENISKDFENTLIKNAQKEKEAPQMKEDAELENNMEDMQEDNASGFNWFLFVGGVFALIVGGVTYLLFKNDNSADIKSDLPNNGNDKQVFKDFL